VPEEPPPAAGASHRDLESIAHAASLTARVIELTILDSEVIPTKSEGIPTNWRHDATANRSNDTAHRHSTAGDVRATCARHDVGVPSLRPDLPRAHTDTLGDLVKTGAR
jgi:hypothetical protein